MLYRNEAFREAIRGRFIPLFGLDDRINGLEASTMVIVGRNSLVQLLSFSCPLSLILLAEKNNSTPVNCHPASPSIKRCNPPGNRRLLLDDLLGINVWNIETREGVYTESKLGKMETIDFVNLVVGFCRKWTKFKLYEA